MSRNQNVGQNSNTKVGKESFEHVKKLNIYIYIYLETTIKNQNYFYVEIKSRLNSDIYS
jgi:hypothetical protein